MCGGGGGPISSAVSAVSNAANDAVSSVGKAIEDVRTSNPVTQYVGQLAGDTGRVIKAPIEVAYDVTRGDIQHASNVAQRGAGSAARIVSSPSDVVWGSDAGQRILTDPTVDKYTLGYSADYAGTIRGINSTADRGELSNADRDSALRWGVKTAVIAGGAALYSPKAVVVAKDVTEKATLFSAAAKSLASGNYKDLAAQLGADEKLPDWLNGLLPDGSGSKDVSTPVQSGPASSSVTPVAASASIATVLAVAGLVLFSKK